MSDLGEFPPEAAARDPHRPAHARTGEWQSFEARMRTRRIARCLERAAAALEAGQRDTAESALGEARALDPEAAEVLEFEKRLTSDNDTAPLAAPRGRRSFAFGVASAAFIAAAAFGAWRQTRTSIPAPPPDVPLALISAGAPAAPAQATAPPPSKPALRVVQDTVMATEMVPTIVGTNGDLAATRTPALEASDEPVAASMPAATTTPDPAAPAVPAAPLVMPSAPDRLPEMTLPPPPPVSTSTTAASETAPPKPAPEPVREAEPRPAPAAATPPRIDPREQVRQVLTRYEAAYSRLDAQAAREIWPTVDQKALARAFDGLASQNVSLGRCDVEVLGQIARAHCSGTARWTPKIGGGARMQPRQWEFQLAHGSTGWEIVSAGVR